MSQHACKVDSSPSLDELSERVCSDPVEMDSRLCAAHQLEDFRMVKRAAIPAPCDQEDRNAALDQWEAAVRRLRLIAEEANNCTPAEFVKTLEEFMPELRKAAMRTVIHPANCDEKEE
jgi:hypothetical protein